MNILHKIDCMEHMDLLPDKFYDLAIVDPPYGIGESSKNHASRTRTKKFSIDKRNNKPIIVKPKSYKHSDWDNKIPDKIYFNELFRISKNQIIWGGNYFIEHLKNTPCFIVWDKVNGKCDFADCEIAWTSFKTAIRQVRYMWFGYNQGKSITEGYIMQGNKKLCENKTHPTQKPIALYKWLLTNYAKPGYKLFDSHSGSGSFRIAAYDMGFDLVSCELDADYCRDNEARFQQHIQQIDLFKPEEIQKNIYMQGEL